MNGDGLPGSVFPDQCGELYELLGAWCDGTLDAAECRRLEDQLGSSAAARRFYIEYLDMHARLRWDRRLPVMARALQAAGSKSKHRYYLAMAAALVLVAAVLVARIAFKGGAGQTSTSVAQSRQGPARQGPAPFGGRDVSLPIAATPAPVVAHVGKLVNCRWTDSRAALSPGDPLRVGQVVRLAAGVAEIQFELGVRVVVQAPAVLTLETTKSARLERGKLSAEILAPAARGFQISTPDGDFVDQGTEFGVEVSPDGNSRVHVFQGEVDVKHGFSGKPAAPQRLLARAEAWLEKDSQSMQLREDTGSAFIRNVEQADRDRHVVAYWRFEDRPLGAVVPHTMQNQRSERATVDSSFNGNDLFAYTEFSHPRFSREVPAPTVYGSGEPNTACLDNSEPSRPGTSRDLYTHSAFSHAAPLDLQSIVPRKWTIEASIKPAVLTDKQQTFLGRDGNEPGAAVVVPTRLAFHVNNQNRFAIWFVDTRERKHETVADTLDVKVGAWYHLAATSDGRTLKLYVDALDGQGYKLRAETQLPDDDGTALSKGGDGAEWSLGRGKVRNHVAENFQGWIDEVRISDIARKPGSFLFAKGPNE
jgi:ferric-dicitrate binding protein FerR (iron transport regulator)